MPFETPSLPVLIKRTQSDLAGDSLRQSDAQVLARTLSGAAYGLYGYLDWIAEQILPDTADESTLERIAALRLNQPRKPAQVASGSVSFSATAGALLDVDTLLQASDGRTYKVTSARTAINGSNTTTIAALEAGSLGNADAGLALTPVQPIAGVVGNSFVVLAPGLSGGVARESLESLRSRVIRSYRIIPHGGSADDYETWALEVPGVTRAWCRGGFLGPGTVGVYIMRDDDPQPVPNDEQLAQVQAYIEPLRPVTAEVHVRAPIQVPVTYRLKLTPDTSAVRAAVETQLRDLHNREADLGEDLLISHIREAISSAAGETDHVLSAPVANVIAKDSELLTFGGCVWGA
ncbi:baseplate J/gp47 family protein [Pseudomonas granadensis]|uniref:Baseplate J/gp47 family protein n=1 Tax=Pseudomonas granadensis TaxID=1421430 RepID=A0ABX7GJI0_9PSED|nr:baseplate J/gp47 family protein [Pseudomonas granadensis]MBN6775520.1 baseplate J/gp47 family protein [Pseudomonas granadensis]MBN6806813.1 baseplate J/gp47 family protein [Pseudomonas granadensis]MBN6833530.1 baseplate J/gp47 family protein [Pseudomonas granadensis]MBN6841059.1 baseplate J/gp47 family protein [Pseudomonas granadensis]MBN6866538.1 baseplate J/gp47 family protein [Pseudomonas granadensis]